VDTSRLQFGIASFIDDEKATQFETLLLRFRPKEILIDKQGSSKLTSRLIRVLLGSNLTSAARSFPSEKEVLDAMRYGQYFKGGSNNNFLLFSYFITEDQWPAVIREIRRDRRAFSVFGATINYFEEVSWVSLSMLDAHLFIQVGN